MDKLLNEQTGAYLTDDEVISMAVAILSHRFGLKRKALNSPSGVAEPSHTDETTTQALKAELALVAVRQLDHFIVAGGDGLWFAERGLL